MYLLVVAPFILLAQPSGGEQFLGPFQERLEAIPEALIDGKRAAMPGLVAKAVAEWERANPGLLKFMPEPEVLAITMQLKGMKKMKPLEQAIGALGVSSGLSRFQTPSRQQDLLRADRTAMLVWCDVTAGQWGQLPRLEEAFQPLFDQDKGQHPKAVLAAQGTLKRLRESLGKHQATTAKKALKELLNLVDEFEKP